MEKIIVVDFGSQYNQVIVKALRNLNIYSELVFYDEIKEIDYTDVLGIILSGGPCSVYDEVSYKLEEDFLDTDIPILGICYGMQYMVHTNGGLVSESETKEFGVAEINITMNNLLTLGTPNTQNVWMSHNDSVSKLGPNFDVLARTNNHIALVKHKTKQQYGAQFHLEVLHTEFGIDMLSNFASNICKVKKEFDMQHYVADVSRKIKEQVGDKEVVCALSGGVDSSVVAALLNKVIPGQVHFFCVDTGLMRKNEITDLANVFKNDHNLDVTIIDGTKEMFANLKGVTEPEAKRKVIGAQFIKYFRDTLAHIKEGDDIEFLAQGTLYSDVIESGTKSSHTIKSHHNVGGLPDDINFAIIEPLHFLFKDEVRMLGKYLGLPDSIVMRQPFPGPGLGIRVIGEVTKEKVEIVRSADYYLRSVLDKHVKEFDLWQYFCVLTDTKSVGVKGDMRAYEYVLAIRAVNSADGMTANFAKIDLDILAEVSTLITNNVDKITRVVYDITSKPPGTIEWE